VSRSKQPRHRRSEQPRPRQADTAAAAPCPKCETNALFTKQYLIFDGGGPPRRQALFRESFTYQFVNPNAELVWDMEQARAILAKHPRDPQLVDPDWLASWLSTKETFVPEHLEHIPPDKREDPGIVVQIAHAEAPGQPMEWLPILVDGSHRGALALREGRDFYAYELTEKEQYSICTYTPGGGRSSKMPLVRACGCRWHWQHLLHWVFVMLCGPSLMVGLGGGRVLAVPLVVLAIALVLVLLLATGHV
jgi:hypothetical protein